MTASKDRCPFGRLLKSAFTEKPIKLGVMINLFIVRHGTTEAIENRVMEGKLDSPLSPHGREEAVRAADALMDSRIDKVFCSPMKRTRETAEIICGLLWLKYQIVNELREMNFGIYEGKTYFEVPDQNSSIFERLSLFVRILAAQLSGEPLFSVARRARRAWTDITRQVNDGSILIVSHGALINYLIKFLLPVEDYQRIHPVRTEPCSISEIIIDDSGKAKIWRLNDTHHLK